MVDPGSIHVGGVLVGSSAVPHASSGTPSDGVAGGLADERTGGSVVGVACDGVTGGVVSEVTAAATTQTRLRELAASAAALGVARVMYLGYADSGHGPMLYPDPAVEDHPLRARASLRVAEAGRAGSPHLTGHRSGRAGYRLLLRLPTSVFGFLLGREWFIEAGATPHGNPIRHVLDRA